MSAGLPGTGIGAGILGGLFATGLTLALLFVPTPVLQPDGSMAVAGTPPLFRWVVVIGTLGILALVVVGVEVLALTVRVRRRGAAVRRLRVARRRRALPVPEPELREVA